MIADTFYLHTTAELGGVMLLDWLRIVCVALTVVCMWRVTEPIVAQADHRARRVWLLMILIWGWGTRGALAAVAQFGSPRSPLWGTPFSVASCVFGIAYLVVYQRDVRRGKVLALRVAEYERQNRQDK